ncbi:MAG: polymerase sigma factor SigW [Parcubacteria group bacterium]|nr:polymerase sigma factor SigW [Parcubacteria group bacterium]
MVEPTDLTDEMLAICVQKGDAEAFGTLVERYEAKLLRYGRKFTSQTEDIKDLVQNVFMKAYENIKSFDTTARFSPWVYRIAHNVFVSHLRQKSRNPLLLVDFDTFIAHPVYDDPHEREIEQKEIKKLVTRGLDELSPKYREVLTLYYIEDLPYKEIAEILQVPIGTVGIRIKRARDTLRSKYKHNPYGPE